MDNLKIIYNITVTLVKIKIMKIGITGSLSSGKSSVAKILSKNNLSGDDISLFIPHQANKRIIDAAAQKCGIDEEKVLINIEKYGNTTAGTIPIAMNEAVNENRIKDGDYILLSSFGAGFTWGSMLVRWEMNF